MRKPGRSSKAPFYWPWVLSLAFVILAAVPGQIQAKADGPPSSTTATLPGSEKDRGAYDALAGGSRIETSQSYQTPKQKTVYLTFDDGPSKLTETVLDILKKEQVHGTFFVLGQMAERQEALIKRMKAEGHVIGNHTYDHQYSTLYRNFGSFWDEVQKTDGILEKITGERPKLFRAPGGTYTNFDSFYFFLLERAGYEIFDWNVDSGDSKRRGVPEKEIVKTVESTPLKHEMVVLLHDGTNHDESVKALPEIIRFYKSKGYAFATLGPQVKPVQFRLGKSKWSRTGYSYESFEKAVALADIEKAERGGQTEAVQQVASVPKTAPAADGDPTERGLGTAVGLSGPGSGGKSQGNALLTVPADAQVQVSPWTVILGGMTWVVDPSRSDFTMGRLAVPLRELVERQGGLVHWDRDRRVAQVMLGGTLVEFDPIRRVVVEASAGGPEKVHYLADVRLVHGEIRVSLEAAESLLMGGGVARYDVRADMRLVAMSLRKELLFVSFDPEGYARRKELSLPKLWQV